MSTTEFITGMGEAFAEWYMLVWKEYRNLTPNRVEDIFFAGYLAAHNAKREAESDK